MRGRHKTNVKIRKQIVTKAAKVLHTLELFLKHKLDSNIKETAYDLSKDLTSDEKQKTVQTSVS